MFGAIIAEYSSLPIEATTASPPPLLLGKRILLYIYIYILCYYVDSFFLFMFLYIYIYIYR
jgi:hypothetical protein